MFPSRGDACWCCSTSHGCVCMRARKARDRDPHVAACSHKAGSTPALPLFTYGREPPFQNELGCHTHIRVVVLITEGQFQTGLYGCGNAIRIHASLGSLPPPPHNPTRFVVCALRLRTGTYSPCVREGHRPDRGKGLVQDLWPMCTCISRPVTAVCHHERDTTGTLPSSAITHIFRELPVHSAVRVMFQAPPSSRA